MRFAVDGDLARRDVIVHELDAVTVASTKEGGMLYFCPGSPVPAHTTVAAYLVHIRGDEDSRLLSSR